VLWYGDELGMGENLALKERQAVRTPMQWSAEPHGGFTRGPEPVKPLVSDGAFAPERVNVADQRRDPQSLLNWMERLVRARKECREIGWGRFQVLRTGNKAVLALRYDWQGSAMVVLHNLSSRPCTLTLDVGGERPCPLLNVLSTEHSAPRKDGRHQLPLEGYGYRWFRVGEEDDAKRWMPDVAP
jgi:maltose alpha-D-glucosyltransferase/alpha-amylase